jgi:hypothetical protein
MPPETSPLTPDLEARARQSVLGGAGVMPGHYALAVLAAFDACRAERDRLEAEVEHFRVKAGAYGQMAADANQTLGAAPGDRLRDAARRVVEERDRLQEEAAWVRAKLGLPADTPANSGKQEATLYGTLHVLCSHAHGYETYIKAFKCDDKQGEIARLAVERDRLALALDQARGVLRRAEWTEAVSRHGVFCPACFHQQRLGHAPACPLARALSAPDSTPGSSPSPSP